MPQRARAAGHRRRAGHLARAAPACTPPTTRPAACEQELRQIEFVRRFPQVVGFGVWNGESPRLVDRTFVDTRRGLTSYGCGSHGRRLVLRPRARPRARRALPARTGLARHRASCASPRAMRGPLPRARTQSDAIVGQVDPLSGGDLDARILTLNGWLVDPDAVGSTGIDGLDVYLGTEPATASKLTGAQLGLSRTGPAQSIVANPDWTKPGFLINLPLDGLPSGADRAHARGAHARSRHLAEQPGRRGAEPGHRSRRSLRSWRNPLLHYPRRRCRPSAPKSRRRSPTTRSAARSSSRWSRRRGPRRVSRAGPTMAAAWSALR